MQPPNEIYSDADIEYAETILLPPGKHFTAEHRAFIQCQTSASIQACPGSGKTTALLAKLLIIDKKLLADSDSGVLVLSHTNAAVDEIKKRIAQHCTKLFAYPNFVGTIQEFTDKFLGIPSYQELFKKEVASVDTDISEAVIAKELFRLKWDERKTLFPLATRTAAQGNIPEYVVHHTTIDFGSIGTGDIKFLSGKGACIAKDATTPRHKALMATKYHALEKGHCTFLDMYQLAFYHLKNHPLLSKLIAQRFPLVFIDEMQDMNADQHKLVEVLFGGKSSSVTQCIGDINQSIYHDNDQDAAWQPRGELLTINGTMRLSTAISAAVSSLSITQQTLVSLNSSSDLKPRIIIFDDTTVGKVIETFSKLIRKHGLDHIAIKAQKPIKIVGWVGTNRPNATELTLSSYHPDYKRPQSLKKDYYERIDEYTALVDHEEFRKRGGRIVSDTLYSSLAKLFYISGYEPELRPYTAAKVKRFLAANQAVLGNSVRGKILECCQYIAKKQNTMAANSWREFIKEEVCTTLEIDMGQQPVRSYMMPGVSAAYISRSTRKTPKTNNIYAHPLEDDAGTTLELEIASVHAVKGQTHTATLYVETYFNRKHDSDRILNILLRNRPSALPPEIQKNMKMSYVGMTRATHLICLAIHKSRISDKQIEQLETNWDIEYITERLEIPF